MLWSRSVNGVYLDPVMSAVSHWVQAIYRDRNTAAALWWTHPNSPLPAEHVGEHVRRRYPWLDDPDVEFLELVDVGPDRCRVDVLRVGRPAARIVVAWKFGTDFEGPEEPLVFSVVVPEGWTGGAG